MSAETLLTAARRMVRFFRIDESKGGITTVPTLQAWETLDQQIKLADHYNKQAPATIEERTELSQFLYEMSTAMHHHGQPEAAQKLFRCADLLSKIEYEQLTNQQLHG